jgi:hypothetical protein
MEHLLMVDALKRASPKRITVVHAVLPLRPAGQEAPRSRADLARLIADLLRTAGADRLMTVDLHTDQTQGFFDGPVDHCSRCAPAGRPRRATSTPGTTTRGERRLRPGAGGRALAPTGSGGTPWPSSTRPDPTRRTWCTTNRVVGASRARSLRAESTT